MAEGEPARCRARLVERTNDGEWMEIGEPIEMTVRFRRPDGSFTAPAGTCPECARLPLSDTPIVCPHGVAIRPGGQHG